MPAILTNNLSVINAENFVDSFVNGDSNVYMAIGRGYETDDNITGTTKDNLNKWDDESNPEVPIDSIAYQRRFRELILGMKKVLLNDILIMVPRVDWIENRIFHKKNEEEKVGVRATDYYCLNSHNEVWECINAPTNETQGVTVEPVFNKIDLSDETQFKWIDPVSNEEYWVFKEIAGSSNCYWWKYLYTIPTGIANKKLLDSWMPVTFNKHGTYEGGTLTDTQYYYGDKNANRTLGAYRVMVSCTLSDEDTKIPYDCVYRQVGLLVDPTSKKMGADTVRERLEGSLYDETEFDVHSGELIYLENKKPIMREEQQTETLNLILVF